MGRRALRKINPAIDVSGHLYTLDRLPRVDGATGRAPHSVADPARESLVGSLVPLDFQALFGRRAPVEIEVGSGKGLFLRTASAAMPERDFLGIEIARRYAEFIAGGLARQQAANARIITGDARRLFAELLPEEAVEAVHVYFPDPWWKARHRKRRIMDGSFLRQAERVLRPGGTLHFWTDVEEYFHSALETVAAATRLEGPFDVPEAAPEHEFDYRTHFERRMRRHGEPVYRSRFTKPGETPQP